MRIAFITESYSVGMGYTENMLPRYLAKHGNEVRVFCSNLQIYGGQLEYKDVYEPYLGPAEQPCGELNEDGFVVERLQHFMLGHYIGIRGLKEALLRFRPDVIQATSVVSVATLEALMARHAVIPRSPVFTECHQHLSIVRPFLKEQGWSVRKGMYFLTRTLPGHFMSRGVVHCYAIAPDCAYVAIHHYGMAASKVSVLPLGTDTDVFHPVRDDRDGQEREALRAKLNVREGDHVAIYTGRLTDGKNPMLLARAVAALRKSGRPWVGLFVGDGPQKDLISSTDGCHVVGFARHDQLSQYYRAADVAVWPEQESMSMLDVLSSGLPLVVSSSMGDLDRVTGNGLTFTRGSVEDLTAVLSRLTNSDERRRLGLAARAKAEKQYSWDSNARRREADYVVSIERGHES
jgi:glycosyltransferase involved in cell wall biosynthesis